MRISDWSSDVCSSDLQLFINNEWVDAAAGEWFDTEDPFSGKAWAQVPRARAADVDRAVAAAKQAFEGEWSRLSASDRGRLLYKLGELVERNAQRLAEVESRDNGKLMSERSEENTSELQSLMRISYAVFCSKK